MAAFSPVFFESIRQELFTNILPYWEKFSRDERPGYEGFGDTRHKFLEMSNVSVVNEMVQMIVAQRAYEFDSKAIQTSDNMLSTAVNLKR